MSDQVSGLVYKREQPAGERQLLVVFVNGDDGSQIDVDLLVNEIAADAAAREREGWRLVSVGGFPVRQMGTAGNVLFQSGGQFATQVGVVAVYSRD
jgi:hypothetical protein